VICRPDPHIPVRIGVGLRRSDSGSERERTAILPADRDGCRAPQDGAGHEGRAPSVRDLEPKSVGCPCRSTSGSDCTIGTTRDVNQGTASRISSGLRSGDANGLMIRTPSKFCASCRSSVSRTRHALAWAAATISEFHQEIL